MYNSCNEKNAPFKDMLLKYPPKVGKITVEKFAPVNNALLLKVPVPDPPQTVPIDPV